MLGDAWTYVLAHPAQFATAFYVHVALSATALALAAALAIPAGIVAARSPRIALAAVGAANVLIVQADVTTSLPFRARFSTVIVDAPCSGLGTLRRDPDIRWRRDAGSLDALAAAQRQMLDQAARVVAEGGRLVYATCSSEPEENEAVVESFLGTHAGFTPLRADLANPAVAGELVDSRGHLRTEPDRHGLELFFGAVFERSGQL